MRYLTSESEHPISSDYYYEATQTTQDHFPLIPVHSHNYYEIYIFLNGSIKLAVEDKVYKVKYGDIILIPPYMTHQLLPDDISQGYERIYMYITEPCLSSFDFNGNSLLEPFQMAAKNKQYLFHIADKDFNLIYKAMFLIYRSKKTDYYGKDMLNRSRIIEIVTLLNKYILSATEQDSIIHTQQIISEVFAYINNHYSDPLTLDSLADTFYINKYTLARLFKKHMMRTVHEYIAIKRINSAKLKMTEGVSPSYVYLEVGFKDYSTFYRTFKKIEGISPQTFAKNL